MSSTSSLCHSLSRAIVSGHFSNTHSNLLILNSTLQSLSNSSSPQNAVVFYDVMRREGVSPDNYTVPLVLKAVSRLRLLKKGRVVHSESFKRGHEFDVFVQNSLIHMYFVCGSVGSARRVFDLAGDGVGDVVSWNSVISGLVQNRSCGEALRVFGRMMRGSVRPDRVTLLNCLVACARIGVVELGRQIHGYMVVNGFGLDHFLGSSLIDMYAKSGMVEDARRVFVSMHDRNVVCWTSLISGYANEGRFREAIELFREMEITGIQADNATIACVISACGHLGALDHGKQIHAYCDMNGLAMDLKVKNSVIDMYSKCGDIERALQLFHGLVCRDVYSWTVMISGLAMNGQPEKALGLFLEMELLSGVIPNEITFLGVLSACCHGGLIERGFHYFRRMSSIYKLTPKIQHFGCMVDLLGRAKLLKDSEDFIKDMPIKPDAVIWRSLLFACRRNGDVEKAEQVVQQIMELEPANCGVHILLSNVYASASKWTDANRVRREMKNSGIFKQPGCSFIEIDGNIHEFFVGDLSHLQTEVVHELLLRMNDHILSEGYFSDNTLGYSSENWDGEYMNSNWNK